MRAFMLRLLASVVLVAVLGGGTLLVRSRLPRPGPCDAAWRLPVYENGQASTQNLSLIFNCYKTQPDAGELCPPPWSEWHQYLNDDSGCP